MRYYAGIGSRETPPDVCESMELFAMEMRQRRYITRSGGALGADTAFYDGAAETARLYLPWSGYNEYVASTHNAVAGQWKWAEGIAAYHYGKDNWHSANHAVRKLMTRNVAIVLGGSSAGPSVNPSEFVACWTPDGKLKGGTAMGIKVARAYGILVFNFAIPGDKEKLWQFVNQNP